MGPHLTYIELDHSLRVRLGNLQPEGNTFLQKQEMQTLSES